MIDGLLQQADAVTSMLGKLTRRFSVLDDTDPAMELPLAQLKVCAILREGPRRMTCLSRELGISLSATTQLADRLERSGMVERVPDTDDRRQRTLRLTSCGMDIMRRRTEKRAHRVALALENLRPEEREAVVAALQVLLDASGLAQEPGVGSRESGARGRRKSVRRP